ncbi:YheC/YheD family endospore coat-associated protein [Paenibacillus chitinolyticus]|uniref:YheC/YheD family endospore coat-associated protein n=1 Tax=Paenibacillus chitinolyticus TaxID=79263 RepID=UPI001C46C5AE|nr:YheC/YheD family protein [Paenibacillus chitinolyticus]
MDHAVNRCLGVLASPGKAAPAGDSEPFFRKLGQNGAAEGIEVIVFSPDGISFEYETVDGFLYSPSDSAWREGTFPLPAVLYDRCFCSNYAEQRLYRRQLNRLHQLPGIRFLGGGLRGKWDVQRLLAADPALAPHLPLTRRLTSPHQLEPWLELHGAAFLKPEAGMHGKGALHVYRSPGPDFSWSVRGRDRANRPVQRDFGTALEMRRWVRGFIGKRRYLLQQYLPLTTPDGTAYDIRSLMQKDEHGLWKLTGMVVRSGGPGSVTSNLHGGGTACEAEAFLREQFPGGASGRLMKTLSILSHRIALILESSHGRLAELGIDFGVCRDGRIHILEVNSKPGRAAFQSIDGGITARSAASNPVRYAAYLLRTQREPAGATSLGG